MTKQPPTSLRIPKVLQDRVAKWAHEQGIPRNAAYVQLIGQGMKVNGPHPGLNERPLPKNLAVRPPTQLIHPTSAGVTYIGPIEQPPGWVATPADMDAARQDIVHFGPVRPKPGSRLKGKK